MTLESECSNKCRFPSRFMRGRWKRKRSHMLIFYSPPPFLYSFANLPRPFDISICSWKNHPPVFLGLLSFSLRGRGNASNCQGTPTTTTFQCWCFSNLVIYFNCPRDNIAPWLLLISHGKLKNRLFHFSCVPHSQDNLPISIIPNQM